MNNLLTIEETPIGQQFRCVCVLFTIRFDCLSNLLQICHRIEFDRCKECGRLSEQFVIIMMCLIISHTYFIYCNRNWFIASLPEGIHARTHREKERKKDKTEMREKKGEPDRYNNLFRRRDE